MCRARRCGWWRGRLIGRRSTGVGGTVRDLILDRPVFWLLDQTYLAICLGMASLCFFAAHLIQRRYAVLLWLDAIGLAVEFALPQNVGF